MFSGEKYATTNSLARMRIKLKKTVTFICLIILICCLWTFLRHDIVLQNLKPCNMSAFIINITDNISQEEEEKEEKDQSGIDSTSIVQFAHRNDSRNESNWSLMQVVNYLQGDRLMSSSEIHAYYKNEKQSTKKLETLLSLEQDFKILSTLFKSQSEIHHTHSEDRIVQQLQLRLNVTRPRTVLLWDSGNNMNSRQLIENNCPIKNCKFTKNKDKIDSVDAVLFQFLPSRIQRRREQSRQVWIYFQLESAQNTPKTTDSGFINWTATYRSDSILNTPYEKFSTFRNITYLPKKLSRNYAKGKTKLAAWFVSNCGASNGRMEFVKELQQYARIDIYGQCGKLSCDRYSQDCFEKLKKEYKFYLAFENSNCRDYITEKFFLNALSNDVLPIVMGGHPDDYKKLAPPNSFIHVDYFRSPRELAEYMHILDSNDNLYNKYFRWKGTGEFINTKFICRLCSMLQLAPEFSMWYPDLSQWWRSNGTCILPNMEGGERWASWRYPSQKENKTGTVFFNFATL